MWMQSYCEGKNRKSRPFIELKREEQKAITHSETVKRRKEWREEQKAITLYKTMKGKTGIPKDHLLMKSYEIVKGRIESHDPIWNHKGKNRNPKCLYTHVNAVTLWREEQKVITLCETIKGRTGIPKAHIPLKEKNNYPIWNCKGKNRKP